MQYRNSVQRTEEATLKKELFQMRDVIDQYYADKGKYPSSLDSLVSDGYMRKIPDGSDLQVDRYVADRARRTGSRQSHPPNQASTTSRAAPPAPSLDGTNYSDW